MAWQTFGRNRATALVDRCMAGCDLPADAGTAGRRPISQFMTSPLDQAPGDAWACFPRTNDGNFAPGLAATVTAPAHGVFVRSTTLSTVSRGERAATLGLLRARPPQRRVATARHAIPATWKIMP